MVVTCPGCHSWFIVCAAHLEDDRRNLRCLKCGSRWPAPAGRAPAPGTAGPFAPASGHPAAIGIHDPAVREAVATIREAVTSICAQAREADRPGGRASRRRGAAHSTPAGGMAMG